MLHFRWIGCQNVFALSSHHHDNDPLFDKQCRRCIKVGGCPPIAASESLEGHKCMHLYVARCWPSNIQQQSFWGIVDSGRWEVPFGATEVWGLIAISAEHWSINGTPFPIPTITNGRQRSDEIFALDCVTIRNRMGLLFDLVSRPIATLSPDEDVERANIVHEWIIRLHAMRWMHVLILSIRATGSRWEQLTLMTDPISRAARIHTLNVTRCAKQHITQNGIVLRQLTSAPNHIVQPPAATNIGHTLTRDMSRGCATATGSECIQYMDWLSVLVRCLLEECIIYLQSECQSTQGLSSCSGPEVCTSPEAQRNWLETWESTDRQATLDDSWNFWVRQRNAIHCAYGCVVKRWEQFQFTVKTYGFQRLTLFEQAKVTRTALWALASIERAQLITLYAVAHLTPQLGTTDRIRFCQFVCRALLDICGQS